MTTHTLRPLLCAAVLATLAIGCSDEMTEDNNTSSTNNGTVNQEQQLEEWNMCRMDTEEYTQFEETISSIGRVNGFEEIADRLWRVDMPPMASAFDEASMIYLEPEGLDSRVSRREDEHYEPVTNDDGETLRCRDEGVPEMAPDRCVGPAQIKPIIIDALGEGGMGTDPEVNAARIEAALLWFFYVSTYKETVTCTQKKKDCDSSYAYYTGGQPESGGIGLAGYFREHVPTAHELTWDGLIAMRCWRSVDDAETAMNIELRDRALEVLDEGLLYGMSRLVTWRLGELEDSMGVEREADWAFLQILGPVLDRAAQQRDADQAAELMMAWEADSPDNIDPAMVSQTITELFPEPTAE